MAKPKTAIVLIHGIGEQRPMDTLWGFVEAAWVHDPQLVHPSRNEVWSKPELVTGSFELRRVTTREGSFGDKRRCDFFEFYWAHRMQGHTLGGLVRWSLGLFVRPPSADECRRSICGPGLMVAPLPAAKASTISSKRAGVRSS